MPNKELERRSYSFEVTAQDAYAKGDKVRYPDERGDVWISDVDGNVWEPGVYGWTREV